jgi:hypothetical protein
MGVADSFPSEQPPKKSEPTVGISSHALRALALLMAVLVAGPWPALMAVVETARDAPVAVRPRLDEEARRFRGVGLTEAWQQSSSHSVVSFVFDAAEEQDDGDLLVTLSFLPSLPCAPALIRATPVPTAERCEPTSSIPIVQRPRLRC